MIDHVWIVTFKCEPDWPHIGAVQTEVWLDGGRAYDRYVELMKPDQRNEWASVQRVEVKDGKISRN